MEIPGTLGASLRRRDFLLALRSRGRLPLPQYLFYPSIDPLADKNIELEPEFIERVLELFSIDSKRPILTQISRFDRLKDPVGVIRAYRLVKRYFDCQLVLAGGSATDDPEGSRVLDEVRTEAGNDRGHPHSGAAGRQPAGGQRAAACLHHRDSEEPARRVSG